MTRTHAPEAAIEPEACPTAAAPRPSTSCRSATA